MSERLNRRINENQKEINSGFNRMAEIHAHQVKASNTTSYLRGDMALLSAEYEEKRQRLEELGKRDERGTEIFELYRRVEGGAYLPAEPEVPEGPFGEPGRPALPEVPEVIGGKERLEDALDDWSDAWRDFRDYSIMDGDKLYNKAGRFFAKVFGYGTRALVGYGSKVAWRRGGLARRRRKLRKAEEERKESLKEAARLRTKINLDDRELLYRQR